MIMGSAIIGATCLSVPREVRLCGQPGVTNGEGADVSTCTRDSESSHSLWLSFPFSVPWVLQPCISEPASHRNTGRHGGHGVPRGSGTRPGQDHCWSSCCCFLAAPCACLPSRSTMPGKRRTPSTLSQRNAATSSRPTAFPRNRRSRHWASSMRPAPCSKSPGAMRPRPRH